MADYTDEELEAIVDRAFDAGVVSHREHVIGQLVKGVTFYEARQAKSIQLGEKCEADSFEQRTHEHQAWLWAGATEGVRSALENLKRARLADQAENPLDTIIPGIEFKERECSDCQVRILVIAMGGEPEGYKYVCPPCMRKVSAKAGPSH